MNADLNTLITHIRQYNNRLSPINRASRTTLFDDTVKNTCTYTLSESEKRVLHTDVEKASALLKPYRRLHRIPWKFALVKQSCDIENNYPHTHADTIFLPSMYFSLTTDQRTKLLIHEKVHIYQRYNPIPYNKIILKHFGYAVHGYIPSHPDFDRVRANPDTNDIIYCLDKKYVLPLLHPNAKRLSNVRIQQYAVKSYSKPHPSHVDFTSEHPNEILAYYLENAIPLNSVPSEWRALL